MDLQGIIIKVQNSKFLMWRKLDIATVLVSLIVFLLVRGFMRRRKLPPGPRGLPFLGNLLEMPREQGWIKFTEWSNEYGVLFIGHCELIPLSEYCLSSGDIIHVSVLNQPLIVISPAEEAIELLQKRSGIYSNRPYLLVAGEPYLFIYM